MIPRQLILALAGAIVMAAPAQAGVIIQQGVVGNFNDDNVISSGCAGGTTGPASTIKGCLNSSHTTLVDFQNSNEQIEFAAGGQAKIISADADGFDNLKIFLDNGATFQTLIVNIEAGQNGTVTFDALPGSSFALNKNGNNFFSISGADFTEITFTSTVNVAGVDLDPVDDVKQVRLGIGAATTVAEPSTTALVGAALLGLSVVRRRRKA